MWGRSRFARSLMINPDSGGRLRSNRCWHSCMQHGCAAALTDYTYRQWCTLAALVALVAISRDECAHELDAEASSGSRCIAGANTEVCGVGIWELLSSYCVQYARRNPARFGFTLCFTSWNFSYRFLKFKILKPTNLAERSFAFIGNYYKETLFCIFFFKVSCTISLWIF